jgi:hypothetical protein
MLFHSEVYLPTNLTRKLPCGQFSLTYSAHARKAALSDRYGIVRLLPYLDTSRATVIEVEVSPDWRPIKILYRVPVKPGLDACYAVVPNRNGAWFVKTVWYNEQSDRHATLDKSRYYQRV